jgi:hypothetical protein
MTAWTIEELVDSIAESNKRKDEHMRRIAQEDQYQESLYDMLRQALHKKPEMPQAFQ